jgi:hypothetical protein
MVAVAASAAAAGGSTQSPARSGPPAASSSIQFQEVAAAAGITYAGRSWGCAWTDFNGDGFPDLWAVNHQNAPSLYLNLGDGTFVDVAGQVLLPQYLNQYDKHGAIWADFDSDGDPDLYQLSDAGGSGVVPKWFFVNDAGLLNEQAVPWGLDYPIGRGRMPLWLDYDDDGQLDVLHPTSRRGDGSDGPTALFHRGSSSFTDAASQVGLIPNDIKISNFALLSDLSGDGRLDLLTHLSRFPEEVYDTGSVPFVDLKSSLGISHACCVKDAISADFDGDLDNDLYMVRGEAQEGFVQVDTNTVEVHLENTLETGISFQTTGDVTLDLYWAWATTEVFIGAAGANPAAFPFTVSSADPSTWGIFTHVPAVDRGVYVGFDSGTQTWQILRSLGDMANVVIEGTSPISAVTAINWSPATPPQSDVLLMNLGGGFANQSLSRGFLTPSSGHGALAGDFDNDMDLDIYVVSTGPVENLPNRLYENQGSGTFVLVPDAGGAAGNNVGRGDAVASADYDRDGFLDLAVTNGTSKAPFDRDGPTFLFRNLGNGNHWIEIDLEGTVSNRDGIGARLIATAGGVAQLREQAGGIHSRGQNHQRVHFGLGSNTHVDITISWPSGIVQMLEDVAADQILRVVEPGGTSAQDDPASSIRGAMQCYPNPFRTGTTVAFSLQQPGPVRLHLYDAAGRLVRSLLGEEVLSEGAKQIYWNGRDASGRRASSGVYFVRLNAGPRTETNRVVLLD